MKICICGKGGSGKSTLVTLMASVAREKGFSPLVIDSDESNSGLYRMLGFNNPPFPLMELLGGKAALKENMQKPDLFKYSEITIEKIPSPYIQCLDGIALVSIGKILQALEGCACPMGVLNREFLKKLRLQEKEVAIVDMEAGVEHFGRGIDEAIDKVVIVVEPSFESLLVAEKIQSLAGNMKKKVYAVLNKVGFDRVTWKLTRKLNSMKIEIIGTIPDDPLIFEACLDGRVPEPGKALHAVENIYDILMGK